MRHFERQNVNLQAPLPIPVTPVGDEGFVDLLYRSAAANLIGDVRFLADLVGTGSVPTNHSAYATLGALDSKRISEVLGTDNGATDISPLSYLESDIGERWVSFFGRTVARTDFSRARRVAPTFLEEQGRYRAVWSLYPLGFDPGSREMLLSVCPACEQRLRFTSCLGIERCEKCGADLRRFRQPKVSVSDEHALDFVAGLVDPTIRQQTVQMHEAISCHDDGEIFCLVVAMAQRLQFAAGDDGWLPRSKGKHETSVSAENLVLAGRAVLGWPEGIYSFVEKVSPAIQDRVRLTGFARGTGFRRVPSALLAKFALEWSVGVRNYLPSCPSSCTLSMSRGRRSASALKNLADTLYKGGHQPPISPSSPEFVVHYAQSFPSVCADAIQIGLPIPVLLNLYRNNLLPIPEPQLVPCLSGRTYGLEVSSRGLEERLRDVARKQTRMDLNSAKMVYLSKHSNIPALLRLSEVVFATYLRRNDPWTRVFYGLLSQKISFLLTDRDVAESLVDRITIDDFYTLKALMLGPNSDDTTEEICCSIRLTKGECRSSMRRLTMPPGLFAHKDISYEEYWNWRREFITSREIRTRILMKNDAPSVPAIIHTLATWGVQRIDKSGTWCRNEVESVLADVLESTIV